MLRSQLIHPEISAAVARAGHHSKILIADGNYPTATKKGPNAQIVSLNLRPGLVTVSQVLETLLAATPIEAFHTMGVPPDDPYALDGDPPVWKEYRELIANAGLNLDLEPIQKWDFYDAVASEDHALTIQTGDQALFANLILTIGVRKAGE